MAGSDEDGRAGATNERRPSRAARRRCGQSARRWRGKGRVLGRLALGRASGALAPHRPRGRPAWARALRRREVKRGPSAQAKTSPEGIARSTARIPLSPRGAVFASQRSEVSGARHPSLSGVPRGHPARPCTPRVSPLGDTGTEKGISAADCSRHYPPLLPLRLTFKPRQNGAAARLRPGRMRKRGRGGGRGRGCSGPTQARMANRDRLCVCADVTSDNALWLRRRGWGITIPIF